MILWWYKSWFDTMKEDMKLTKTAVAQIQIDVAVLKSKFNDKNVSISFNPLQIIEWKRF